MFPPETDLVLPPPGGKIALGVQQPWVKEAIYGSFLYAYHHLLFIESFPAPATKTTYGVKWIIKGAEDANQPLVAARARAQIRQYTRPLIPLVCI